MAGLRTLDDASQPNMVGLDTNATLTLSNATVGPTLTLKRSSIGAGSIALMNLNTSGASVPVFALQGSSFVSAVSIVFAASANWAGLGVVRVQFSDGTTYGWIPVLPSAVVTAGVAS